MGVCRCGGAGFRDVIRQLRDIIRQKLFDCSQKCGPGGVDCTCIRRCQRRTVTGPPAGGGVWKEGIAMRSGRRQHVLHFVYSSVSGESQLGVCLKWAKAREKRPRFTGDRCRGGGLQRLHHWGLPLLAAARRRRELYQGAPRQDGGAQ